MSEERVEFGTAAPGYCSPEAFSGMKRTKYVQMLEERPDELRQMTLHEVDEYLESLVSRYQARSVEAMESSYASLGICEELKREDYPEYLRRLDQAWEAGREIALAEFMAA